MIRLLKISLISLLTLFLIWCFIIWYVDEDPLLILRSFLYVILPVFIISLFIGFAFPKNKNRFKLQWIALPFVFISLILVALNIYITVYDGYHSYTVQWDREQRRIEKTVKRWINKNATHPETYKKISFSNFSQLTKPFIDKGYSFRPIREYYESKDSSIIKVVQEVKYAYYFINHKYLLKNNFGKIDTVISYFKLTPWLSIENVSPNEELRDNIFYREEWTKNYGIENAK